MLSSARPMVLLILGKYKGGDLIGAMPSSSGYRVPAFSSVLPWGGDPFGWVGRVAY